MNIAGWHGEGIAAITCGAYSTSLTIVVYHHWCTLQTVAAGYLQRHHLIYGGGGGCAAAHRHAEVCGRADVVLVSLPLGIERNAGTWCSGKVAAVVAHPMKV